MEAGGYGGVRGYVGRRVWGVEVRVWRLCEDVEKMGRGTGVLV